MRASIAAALLAACGGSQPITGAPGVTPQSRSIVTRAAHSQSWMLLKATSKDLLYVSDTGSKVVDVYSYPEGARVAQLTGFGSPYSVSADKARNVFVTNFVASGASNIVEFRTAERRQSRR
ncbi:MAG: hypothetical protein WA431_12240 [Candidatus Cybelea sp.]